MIQVPEVLKLPKVDGAKREVWCSPISGDGCLVEDAVADYFRSRGFSASRDYFSLITAILLASFVAENKVKGKERKAIIDDVLLSGFRTKERWLLESERYKMLIPSAAKRPSNEVDDETAARSNNHDELLRRAHCQDPTQTLNNLDNLLKRVVRDRISKLKLTRSGGNKGQDYFEEAIFGPSSNQEDKLKKVVDLFNAAGIARLVGLARLDAKKAGQLERKGWPDLLVWDKCDVGFFEVKSPNDRLSKAQKSTIDMIIECGFQCEVVKVEELT